MIKADDSLTLRPEFTAGIARAFLTEGWQQFAPMKLTTSGPVFRYENPQKGRYRQFHQIDAEVLGAAEPAADVELLAMADQLLHELGIAEGVTLQLNTLGDTATRDAWRDALVAHFEGHRGDLSDDSVTRLAKNPLRILDSKDPRDRPIADAAPDIDAYLTSEAGTYFEAVTKGLDAAGVAWTRNARLVRGLDYYRHTAFEFVTDRLGAQGTVLAGGRYDGLIESLGGPPTPGVGWAAGVERLAMLLSDASARQEVVAIIPDGELAVTKAAALSAYLRRRIAEEAPRHPFYRDRYLSVDQEYAYEIAIEPSFKWNQKKQFEKAKSAGVSVIITVRSGEYPDVERMEVSLYRSDADKARMPHGVGSLVNALLPLDRAHEPKMAGPVYVRVPR